MKTKKILCVLLTITIAIGMMATLGITASAADIRSRVIQKPCTNNYCVNGKIKCLTCDGTGKRSCTDCGGTHICQSCGGDETIICWCNSGKCYFCDENGKKDCDLCDAIGYKGNCTLCGGDGIMEVNGSLVTFDTNDTQIKESLTQPDAVENGKTFTAFPVVSAEGKTFLGWSTDKTAKTASYVNGNTYKVLADVTFYAIWKTGNECYLDLDSTTTEILDNKKLDQNYNLTVEEGDKTDKTKVKLSWEIKDINATRTDNKVWNTEELCWETSTSSTTINQQGTAKFTLENYSSIMIDATASFEATSDLTPTVEYSVTDGEITIDTAAEDDTYSKTNVPTGEITVTVTPSDDYFNDKTATTTAVKYGVYTVTIAEHEEEPMCIAAGTKITMADGSLKKIEDITVGEEVLSFNHENGKYEAHTVYVAYTGEGKASGIELTFSDGTTLVIMGEHDLFEKESMKYVTLTQENAKANIGKYYYNAETGKFVMLTSVKTSASANYYSLYAKNTFNCIANGMLTVPDDVDYLLNFYQFNDDLTVNKTVLQNDMETYGLYEYRTDAPYSKSEYDMLNMKYVNILLGKGIVTFDDLCGDRDIYLEQK